MDVLVNAVNVTTRQMVPTAVILPKIIWLGFDGVFFIHRMWRWFRWGSVYKNPDNFFKLVTGHGLNFMIGGSVITRASAQLVLIITRIVECIEKQKAFVKSYQKLLDAFKGNYPICPAKEMTQRTSNVLLPPSTFANVKIHIVLSWNYTSRIAKRIYKLVKSAFKLSMHLMDAVYAFSLSPSTANEGVNQLFVNGGKTLDFLANNKEELLQKLKDNRALLDGLFKKIGSNYRSEHFIEHVHKVLQVTKTTQQAVKKIDHHGTEALKHGAIGFLGGLGLAQLTPYCLIPSREIPWESSSDNEPKERFAPIEWVTRSDAPKHENVVQAPEPLYIKEFTKGQFNKYVEVVLEKIKENSAANAALPVKSVFRKIETGHSTKHFGLKLSNFSRIFAL